MEAGRNYNNHKKHDYSNVDDNLQMSVFSRFEDRQIIILGELYQIKTNLRLNEQ